MRSRARIPAVVLTAMVLGAVSIGHALDCGGRLVLDGASPWDVQRICGDPEQVSETIEVVLKQVWTFNFGSSRLLYILTFLEGSLVKIDTGGYGH